MMTSDYTSLHLPEELGEEIDAEIKWTNENDGIGSYEFWGFRGYDAGQDYMDIYEINPIFTDQSEELQASILKYIDDNWEKCSEQVELSLMEKWNDQAGDI